MRFDIMTIFPDMMRNMLSESIIGRAQEKGLVQIYYHNIRDYSKDKHKRTDDTPYGGGYGMVMTPQPIIDCYNSIIGDGKDTLTVYMSPAGKVFNQKKAISISKKYKRVIILCGHYEGVDQRAIDAIIDEEISVGDYVLTGGEIPAAILADSVSRLVPGVLPDKVCHEDESIESGLLEYPQYTKPRVYDGMEVPQILIGGHHANIEKWRREKSIEKTFLRRKDLLRKCKFSKSELEFIEKLRKNAKEGE